MGMRKVHWTKIPVYIRSMFGFTPCISNIESEEGELSPGMCPTCRSVSQLASHAGHIESGRRRGKLFPVAEARRDGYQANGAASERASGHFGHPPIASGDSRREEPPGGRKKSARLPARATKKCQGRSARKEGRKGGKGNTLRGTGRLTPWPGERERTHRWNAVGKTQTETEAAAVRQLTPGRIANQRLTLRRPSSHCGGRKGALHSSSQRGATRSEQLRR